MSSKQRSELDEARLTLSDKQAGLSRKSMALLAAAGMDAPCRRWFVLIVSPGCDRIIGDALGDAGVECWVPVVRIIPPRRGGRGSEERPVYEKLAFPGYVFVRVAATSPAWGAIRAIRGVAGIIGGAQHPHAVADEIVEGLRVFLAGAAASSILANAVKVGDAVQIITGVFKTFPGVVKKIDTRGRALIDVLVSGRSWPVELDLERITKL